MRRTHLFTVLLLVSGQGIASSFAGPDQFICGTTTTLEADPLGSGETGFWTVVQGNATFGNSSNPTTFVSDLEFGENVLMWTKITPNGASPDNVSIWCYNSAMPLANAGPDQVVTAPPGTAFMNASAPIPPAVCFWTFEQGSGVIVNPNDPNTMVTGITIGPNILSWNCDNGPCGSSADDVIVEGTQVIGIGEAFSIGSAPYYDPIYHRLVFAQQSPSMSITLFDQQGRVVQQLTTPAGAGVWDLSTVPSGIYLAQVRTNDGMTGLRFSITH